MPRISKALHTSSHGSYEIRVTKALDDDTGVSVHALAQDHQDLPPPPSRLINSMRLREPELDPLISLDPMDNADTSDNLSFSSKSQFEVPVEENNYLAPSYDVSDVNLSSYAPSTQPSCPSTSIVNTSTEDIAKFGDVFKLEFYTSFSNGEHTSSSQQWQEVLGQQPPHFMTVTPSSPCPAQSSINAVESFELRPTHSHEQPHNQSSSDQFDPRRPYPCLDSGCTRRFTGQYTLKAHMATHKPRAAFLCTLGCLEKFSRQHDRLRHEVAKHGKICEFTCKECGRFFSTQKTLGKHKCPRVQGGLCWVDN